MKTYTVRHACGHDARYAFAGAKLRQVAMAEAMRSRLCRECTTDAAVLPAMHIDRDHHIVDAATHGEVLLALASALRTVRGEETFSAYLSAAPVARRSHQRIASRRTGTRVVVVNGEWIEKALMESGLARHEGILNAHDPFAAAGDAWMGLPRTSAALEDLVGHLSRAGARIVEHRPRRKAPPHAAKPGAPVIEVAAEPPPIPPFAEMLASLDHILAAWEHRHHAWPLKLEEELAAQEARRLESLNIE